MMYKITMMNRNSNFLPSLRLAGFFTFAFLIFTSCNKADRYYEVLLNEPEIFQGKLYDEVYAVGDVLTIYGRLRSDDLVIRVGDAQAEILEKTTSIEGGYDDVQKITFHITAEMGIGADRPLTVTAQGITVSGPPVEIVEDKLASTLAQALTVEKIADYPAGYTPVHCSSGTGNLYFVKSSTGELMRIGRDGSRTENLLDLSKLKDKEGEPFTLTSVNAAAIDPDERYLYLALYEEAPRRTYFHWYRLCRYGLQDGSFEVLNQTGYHIYRSNHTMEATQPSEGNIADVKLFHVDAIYPANSGKLYLRLGTRAVVRMDTDNKISYLFKSSSSTNIAPQIYDGARDAYRADDELRASWTGASAINLADYRMTFTIDPDQDFLYMLLKGRGGSGGSDITRAITQYDLHTREVGTLFEKTTEQTGSGKLNSVGHFGVLNYAADRDQNNLHGFFPMDGKLLFNKHGDWVTMDFASHWGQFYAPPGFDPQDYVFTDGTDQVLNYDKANDMLYMTSGSKTVLLKTTYR